METRKITFAWMIILVLLFQILLPITSIATEQTTTIVFNDGNLYSAIKESLGEKIGYYNDNTKAIVISNSNLGEVTTLTLKNKGIKDVSGLENFTALKRLELSGNELTVDSNLDKLLNLVQIELLDLSTNKIESLESIRSLYEAGKLIVTNQIIDYIEIVKVDGEAKQTAANITIPDIFKYLEENEYKEFEIESDNINLIPEEFDINSSRLIVGKAENDGYEMFSGKLDVDTVVESGEFKGSMINLTYVVIDKDYEGIIFKDENLYKAIKQQLTSGQLENDELDSHGSKGKTLYKAAYDEELILVIEKDILNNDITSLLLENNQIKDLTGIEYFRALIGLDLDKNYIEDTSKILELQKGKIALRQEIIEKLEGIKSELATLNSSLKSYEEKYKEAEKNIETKRDAIAGKIAAYIRENNANKIEDAKIKEIQETVKGITAKDIDDKGDCSKITAIDGASGVYTKDGENLRKDLLELRELLNKPAELDSEKAGKVEEVKAKSVEFAKAYTRAFELISIISDETMALKLEEINTNNMTAEEIKATFEQLKGLALNEYGTIESKIEDLLDGELDNVIGTIDVEEAKKEIAEFKKTIEKLTESAASINTLKGILQDLKYVQEQINSYDLEEVLASGVLSDEDIVKLARRLENANTEKVRVDYLEILYLGYNNISKLDVLAQIEGLKTLFLNNNLITDISVMQNSELEKSIEVLNLSNNDYIDNVSYLQNFAKLQGLSLAGNSISDISQLDYSKFADLRVLNLSNNRIDDLKDIMKQLKKLEAFKKDKTETANEKIAKGLNVSNQYIVMNIEIPQTDDKTATIELPAIFAQAEAFQPKDVYFENATVQEGITTITVPTLELGENTKTVSINGGIANGTICIVKYEVVKLVKSVSLDKVEVELEIGTTSELVATIEPLDATNKNVVWSSSDEAIATVENGVVKGVAEGNATITVTTEDGKMTATCEVTVKKPILDNVVVKVIPTKTVYELGEEVDLTGLVLEATYTNGDKKEITTGFTCEPQTLNNEGTQEVKVIYAEDEIVKETVFTVTVNAKQEEVEKLEVVTEYEVTAEDETFYMGGISPKTSLEEIASKVVTNGEIRILKGTEEVTDGNLATGMIMEVTLNDEKVEYAIVVTGDCTGDGESDFDDILTINKHRLEKVQIEGEYLQAGDVTNDGKVDFNDILQINKYRLGKIENL